MRHAQQILATFLHLLCVETIFKCSLTRERQTDGQWVSKPKAIVSEVISKGSSASGRYVGSHVHWMSLNDAVRALLPWCLYSSASHFITTSPPLRHGQCQRPAEIDKKAMLSHIFLLWCSAELRSETHRVLEEQIGLDSEEIETQITLTKTLFSFFLWQDQLLSDKEVGVLSTHHSKFFLVKELRKNVFPDRNTEDQQEREGEWSFCGLHYPQDDEYEHLDSREDVHSSCLDLTQTKIFPFSESYSRIL